MTLLLTILKKGDIVEKNVFFVFKGDPICFIHVLLNALDMSEKGNDVKIIIEGESVKLLPDLIKKDNPLNSLWEKALNNGLIEGVCFACAKKLGTYEEAKKQGLSFLDEMSGHPGIAGWQEKGYTIITF